MPYFRVTNGDSHTSLKKSQTNAVLVTFLIIYFVKNYPLKIYAVVDISSSSIYTNLNISKGYRVLFSSKMIRATAICTTDNNILYLMKTRGKMTKTWVVKDLGRKIYVGFKNKLPFKHCLQAGNG